MCLKNSKENTAGSHRALENEWLSSGRFFFLVFSAYNDDHMPHISQKNSNF